MSNPNHVMVIDPLNFGGLLKVPLSKTFETKGRNDWLKGILKKDLSLCCLFQRGKCHAGSKCHQVHADRNFVADLRAQCSHIKSCCLRCGDTASTYPAGRTMFADLRIAGCTTINVQGSLYPLDFLAYTVGVAGYISSVTHVQALMSSGSLQIPALKVCRLHLRAGCKYGKDCKNIHLCSQLGEAVLKLCNRAMECEYSAPMYQQSPPLAVDGPMVPYRFVPPTPATAVPPMANSPPPMPTPQTSTIASSYPTLIPSAESSFNQESINIPVTHHVNFARHSFGEELDEETAQKYDDLSFELKIVSEKKSNFLFRWSHPASASPMPTCLASQSMRNACH